MDAHWCTHSGQEEKEPSIEALKQEKEEVLEKLWVVKKEKNEIRENFEQNNARIQEEKYHLLVE